VCFIPGFVSQISWAEFLIHFLFFIRTKLKRRHKYTIIVKGFDASPITVHPVENYLCFNANLGAGYCDGKAVLAAQFAPLADFKNSICFVRITI